MKEEIIKWYAERHYHIPKMFYVGKNTWGFSQAQIESAMIHCYNKIVNEGKLVHDIDIARYVRNVCRDVDTVKREQELVELYSVQNKLREYKKSLIAFYGINFLLNILFWFFALNWR